MAEVRLTLEEYEALRSLVSSERESEGASLSQRKPKKKPRKPNAWHKFSASFEFRKKRRNESSKDYLAKRSKAASRAYKKR